MVKNIKMFRKRIHRMIAMRLRKRTSPQWQLLTWLTLTLTWLTMSATWQANTIHRWNPWQPSLVQLLPLFHQQTPLRLFPVIETPPATPSLALLRNRPSETPKIPKLKVPNATTEEAVNCQGHLQRNQTRRNLMGQTKKTRKRVNLYKKRILQPLQNPHFRCQRWYLAAFRTNSSKALDQPVITEIRFFMECTEYDQPIMFSLQVVLTCEQERTRL